MKIVKKQVVISLIAFVIKNVPKSEQHDFAHGLLSRELLKIGIDYGSAEISKNRYGKPFMAEHPEIFYNISHSENICACVISGRDCGIDCESVRDYRKGVVNRAFSDREREIFSKTPDDEKNLLFFRLWTLKESYIKAVGTGLSYPLKKAEFIIKNNKIISTPDKNFLFRQYIIKNKYIISVCEYNPRRDI